MTWKHVNKQHAFNYLTLNQELAKEHSLSCSRNVLTTSKIQLSDQAIKMLATLNDFDQDKVLDEIHYVSKHPHSASSIKHSAIPFKRLFRSRTPFKSYHYLIQYEIGPDRVLNVFDIYFDLQLVGPKIHGSHERNMMYHVNRKHGAAKFNQESTLKRKNVDQVKAAWELDKPVHQINTTHAAVNGMDNTFEKAVWLMGSHLDVAYSKDEIDSYTLFHNPSDGLAYDAIECLFDKRSGMKSQNAQHLAAVLHQRQNQGQKTKWVVHSQGAIVFCAALEEYSRSYNGSLSNHEVVLHAPGANINRFNNWAATTGVQVIRENSNPFDGVPNIAGGKDTSSSGLMRSFKFFGLSRSGTELTSSHTLPYLGLESYQAQLQFNGEFRRAKDVEKYIEKNT
jgi:hypothetical protein